ncbi:dual oxidase 2-like isoform X1 [Lingula anatina]|uniref:Dual oxidase 2-like isoform X1 n=2 Tax=Lingula anatina TaxID=7574 RepID=A0A1S3JP96_LINAN|nr:dual oxidase 2-like isoform X1 [Lingula anatina]|eukprot:XP_013412172.1 dual oxidase 2-like isoform X1 [Lingula anatina]
MYDLDGGGTMDRGEFTALLRSMIEMTDSSLSEEEMNVLLEGMFAAGGFENKEELTFEDFKTMLTQEKDVVNLSGGQLKSEIAKKEAASRPASAVSRPRSAEKLKVETDTAKAPTGVKKHFITFQKFVENNFLHIFYLALFFLITIAIFVERSYYYAVLNEAKGLRRMAGYGISVTRGAASSMSFTFSVVLLTMCKNTMNLLRTTWVNNYVPFDAAFGFHKVSAYTSTFIALGHTIGHCINFYHLSTQPPDFVGCVFSNTIWFRSDYLPTFGFYLFQTVTGLTGVVLVVLLTLMIVFATPWARKKVYTAFWTVHNLYVLLYALIILHGSAVLVQDPWFYYFYLGPMLLFALDKLVSISNKSVPVTVLKAEHLPSNVTHITLRKPRTFKNKSGQWARIAIVGHGDNEYHPFTITAAEHEDVIAFHIRAVGPWTTQLRQLMDPERLREGPYPKMYIDGPFGGVSEDWSKYEVAILVGGGIGVTPFAAILKHVSYLASIKAKINCKKIYFFWVTQNQRQFEWMIDIIREVEESDFDDLVTVNVFVTQFFGKFDLRTVMMFLCEKHFVSISERSLFTGLKAPTNFGRPDFQKVIRDISLQWPKVHKFGVFACGPPALTNSVSAACSHVNKTSSASFSFYEENF